ncbi:DUF1858 domain-containing protein [Persephonella atlantica]|uniref:DUF1858 domain-containing protein n=1 Tax=Persephonella atlantica TaxID=2699429 RepID=A0ABS1GFN0_9AQUI|nr:hypothetical protein [Persephonella atlantica]MBK3331729.1 DUF1858 domain-containing protein [Persephonella atlantica]
MVRITEDTKVFHLLEEYPESEEIIRKYFGYFYEKKLEDVALKRLSIKGAFNVLNLSEEERERFFIELNEKLGIDVPKTNLERE